MLLALQILLFSGLVSCGPISLLETDSIKVTKDFFPSFLAIYESENEIVDIAIPLNKLNEEDITVEDSEELIPKDDNAYVFFVEAAVEDGKKVEKGLYYIKNKKVTKVLEKGRFIEPEIGSSNRVFLASNDGIYVFDSKTNKAEKYGNFNEPVRQLAKGNETDVIYALTDKNELFKIFDKGNANTKVEDVKDAEQIIYDYSNNFFFVGKDKKVYGYNNGVVTPIDLPVTKEYVKLVKAPYVIDEGAFVVVDNAGYLAFANGTSHLTKVTFDVHPSAYGAEPTLTQYYGYEKKIYRFNILALIMGEMLGGVTAFIENMKPQFDLVAKNKLMF